MKILTFTTLFPSSVRPNHGIFVATRLKQLISTGEVQAQVVAPVPWFPFTHQAFGKYSVFASTPKHETLINLQVHHPRYFLPPKIGMNIAPLLLAQAAKPTLKRILESGYDFDLIDAHYFYPDGVAAVLLGKYFNKPVTITARGSDINLLPKYRWPRKWIHWASSRASAMITVCEALKQEIGRLDVDESRVITLRNGVDLKKFYPPEDRETERARLGLNNFTLLSVGNLIPLKGHHLVIEAVAQLPEVTLLIAGNGPEKTALENLARKLGVNDRVKILGSIPHDQLRQYYGAADALVLASSREGWANVLLESMACGTPVLATNVSGTPEVVTAPEAGSLINERSVEGIVGAVKTLRTTTRDRIKTRQFAERFSWDETTQGQLQLFNRILGSRTS